ncbi:hemerythrin domain-containing protein [Salinicoccus sp. HZC-1]|uniref:hemerythrin domain-containing protein n=1 Tax=Salinicoccus sp. HZC-1 TaxID=3385497 RepID=UPI00398B0B40
MTGPSLNDHSTHKGIHDEILGGAEEQLDSMKTLLNKIEHKELAEEMESFIEYVEERVLGHSGREETQNGLYESAVDRNPGLQEKVQGLKRDHELIRVMVGRMKQELAKDEVDFQKLIDHATSIILVDEIHSRDEEDILLSGGK